MTNATRGTATIHAFPARGRFALTPPRSESDAMRTPSQAAAVAIGGAWYHDEAIDAEAPRKN